ncbi:hypothetical protein [Curtobacterium sp. UCD-KPL2560]|uniref:hypothetical protein n=1 Tax=Curtobacterium sp. UCD-KPL2560 TaxID=1885315 RepID=UPI00082467C7|nr:hypothetical protein [Curtobacterium sp. UCD-KPL2560]
MATTTRPSTAEAHAEEARRLLSLVRPTALEDDELLEFMAFPSPNSVLAAAQVHATLALVEEQRTANLIAADAADLIASPYQVGAAEHAAYWKAHTDALAERLAVQR